MNDFTVYRCSGATCTNLVVFLGGTSSYKNSPAVFAKAVGADVTVLEAEKASDIRPYCMSKLRRLAGRYERVLFTDPALAHTTVVENCLADCALHVCFDGAKDSLLSAIRDVLGSSVSFFVQAVRDGAINYLISFPEGVFSEEEFDSISEKVAEVCSIVNEDYLFQERYLFPSAGIDPLTVVRLNDTIYGVVKTTKYFQEKTWTEGCGLVRSYFYYIENRTTIGDVVILKVNSLEELLSLIDPSAPFLAMDIETTGLYYHSAYHSGDKVSENLGGRFFFQEENLSHRNHAIISVSVSDRPDRAVVFLVDHPDHPESKEEGLKMLRWVCNLGVPKVFHNAVFDLKWITKYYGIPVRGMAYDTMLQEHFLDENKDSYSLERLTALRLNLIPHKSDYGSEQSTGIKIPAFSTGKKMTDDQLKELGNFAKTRYTVPREKDFSKMPIDALVEYAGIDTILTHLLFLSQRTEFAETHPEEDSREFIYSFIHNLICQTASMEHTGMRVDVEKASQLISDCDGLVGEATSFLDSIFGPENNYDSSKTMAELIEREYPDLYDGLPATKTGKLELTEDTMGQYSDDYPWIAPLLQLRHAQKAQNFLISFLKHSIAGRVHPNFFLTGTATGRITCMKPAMQTLPGSLAGIPIKSCLLPEPSQVLIQVDLRGAETRMLANLSKDENLIVALKGGMDLHALTASEFSGASYDDIVKAHKKDPANRSERENGLVGLRSSAKAVNFGIVYGITEYGLARQLDCSNSDARGMIYSYYEKYPGVRIFFEKVEETFYQNTYVENFIGRRRHFPDINDAPAFWTGKMLRQACNFIIQSSSSDFFQHAVSGLVNVPGITLHFTVHDSVVFSYDESLLPLPDLLSLLDEIFISRPKKLWPGLLEVDMAYALEAGLAYDLGYSLTPGVVVALQKKGCSLYNYLNFKEV